MASLKEVKSRIGSVKSTRKITSAMKMVASAKLHRAQKAIENMLPYQEALHSILSDILRSEGVLINSPLVEERHVNKVAIVVISSNSSLCGSFNSNVFKKFYQTVEKYKSLKKENILVFPIGTKIEKEVRKAGFSPQGDYETLAENPNYAEGKALAIKLENMFLRKEIDKVEIIYHHFKSTGTQLLVNKTYLPLNLNRDLQINEESEDIEKKKEDTSSNDFIIEPSREEVSVDLIAQVLNQEIYTCVLDSNASEHSARMMAMQIATDNADDLIADLTLQYNKTRQQLITNQLLDLASGAQ